MPTRRRGQAHYAKRCGEFKPERGRFGKPMTSRYNFEADLCSVPRKNWPSLLLCLHTGNRWPPYCAPMPRQPSPSPGAQFNTGFLAAYHDAVSFNATIHDGAVLIGREEASASYRVWAWSMRLFPPAVAELAEPNRGSAFNSCLEMSCVPNVDCMYLVTQGELVRFERGRWKTVG